MRFGSRKFYPLLLPIAFAAAGCYPSDHGSQAQSSGIPLPAGALSLPAGGTLSVKVFLDDEATPRFSDDDVDPGTANITLEFTSPEGIHTFTVLFEYYDPEFVREDTRPWELARWNSGPVEVTAGESLSLNVSDSEYVYADSDDDGISNAEDLNDRTDPADDADPGDPGDPEAFLPDGLWRGVTQDQAATEIFTMLAGNRIIMMGGELIYDGSYTAGTQGDFTGSVDVYTIYGEKLTPLAQVAINGNRPDETNLTLNINSSGASALPQSINLTLEAVYERDSALALAAQMWGIILDTPRYTLIFPIDSNGTVTGASDTDRCLYTGNLSLLDAQYNIYGVTLSLRNQRRNACNPFTGTGYTGFASLVPGDDSLLIIVSNGFHALSFDLTRDGTVPDGTPRLPRPESDADD